MLYFIPIIIGKPLRKILLWFCIKTEKTLICHILSLLTQIVFTEKTL